MKSLWPKLSPEMLKRQLEQKKAEGLDKRFQIIDLLANIFIPATLAAAWPNVNPKTRAIIFVAAAALALASGWWGVSLGNSFGVKRLIPRVLLHVYSFIAFVSFILLIPILFAFAFIIFFDIIIPLYAGINAGALLAKILDRYMVLILIMLVTAPVTISIFLVERARARAKLARLSCPQENKK